ncbi:response regulator [Marivirga harenae]|uniref:response regulator n=1 Tax=Marivirga harenae TaxID=2010992 RepID=UPI0026DFE835|nr:response regulator [Marivirga harenae]WKV12003.1 response regulator [Marivirga harenae]
MSFNSTISLKILLVEDNLGDQFLVRQYLMEEFPKLSLDIAANFRDSKTLLSKSTQPYKVILLDLSLPDVDVETLLKETTRLAPRTPIIILTGQEDVRTAIQALTLGCADYLLKDEITSKALRKSITYAFERKHIDRQLESSVKKYQQLFQLNPQPTWVINNKTGNFLEVNNAAINNYGYSKEEFLHMLINDIDKDFFTLDLKKYLTERKTLKNTPLHNHQLKNGKTIQVKLYVNPINYQGIEATLLMSIDLTETESYIRKIEEQNQQLMDIAWEQSHLVRAPLTRMMGIINRLEEKHMDHIMEADKECALLLKNALSSAHEIDDVIRSIVKRSSSSNK